MATSYYFWGTSKSEFAKREEKDGLWMHAPNSIMFSLFFLPLSFFLSLRSFYSQFLITLLSWIVSPFGLPFFWISLRGCLLLSYHGFPPLGASPLGSHSVSFFLFSSMATSSFYIELIQWYFSLLPLGLHQSFLICYGHPFRTTHQPIDCLATTSAQNTLATPLLIS